MPEPPYPRPEDTRPLLPWRVSVSFVCHDIKFADETTGIFQWPEQPAGAPRSAMARVLIAESLSMRNEPDWTDMCELRSLTAEPTTDKPDHPLD
jgi:hypothetical protein